MEKKQITTLAFLFLFSASHSTFAHCPGSLGNTGLGEIDQGCVPTESNVHIYSHGDYTPPYGVRLSPEAAVTRECTLLKSQIETENITCKAAAARDHSTRLAHCAEVDRKRWSLDRKADYKIVIAGLSYRVTYRDFEHCTVVAEAKTQVAEARCNVSYSRNRGDALSANNFRCMDYFPF